LTRLRCPLCGEVVMALSAGESGAPVDPPIVIEARYRNRSRNCSRPLLVWQIRRLGVVERVRAGPARFLDGGILNPPPRPS